MHKVESKEIVNNLRHLINQIVIFGKTRNWQQFYTPKDMSLALVAEVGELIEHFKWHTGKETEAYLKKHRQEIADELADVLFWILLMSHEFGVDIEKAFRAKMIKNAQKYPSKQFRGKHSNPV